MFGGGLRKELPDILQRRAAPPAAELPGCLSRCRFLSGPPNLHFRGPWGESADYTLSSFDIYLPLTYSLC